MAGAAQADRAAGDAGGWLHDLVPKAVRVAVLVNPANVPVAEATLRAASCVCRMTSRVARWFADAKPSESLTPKFSGRVLCGTNDAFVQAG